MDDERRASVLRAVVQQYIETSQPVSSAHVTEAGAVHASSATVRSEMAALEREGFLQQPHTSAGRIPTDRGYRFYVNQLNTPGRLGPAQQQDVRTFFDKASGEIEQMLHETGRLLTNLTGSAAVVVGPDHETTKVRSVQLVSLNARIVLCVVVFSDGGIDKRTLELQAGSSDAVVSAAGARLAAHLDGQVLSGAIPLVPSGNADVDALASKALEALQKGRADDNKDHVFVGGASHLASAFDAVDTVRNVLSILEQQYVMVSLIRNLLDRGVSVSIGAENQMQTLEHCSLVIAPTIIEGEQRGSIAILGPTRMDYGQAMAAVTLVSRRLGERLSEG